MARFESSRSASATFAAGVPLEVRVLASDSDEGLQSAWAVLSYYAQRPGALFQADGEGFYDGQKLILKTG